MQRLNPFSKAHRALRKKAEVARSAARKARAAHRASAKGKAEKAARGTRHAALHEALEESFRAANKIIQDELAAGKYTALE